MSKNLEQQDSAKLYSVHAPEVECIAKGKVNKKYEFGCKVAVVTTHHSNWIVGIDAHDGNPYDGATLAPALVQVENLTHVKPQQAIVDQSSNRKNEPGLEFIQLAPQFIGEGATGKALPVAKPGSFFKRSNPDQGFRGSTHHPQGVEVLIAGNRKRSGFLKRLLKRRSAIEPIIGHTKHDHRMQSNYLQGKIGDRINSFLAGCGFNLRKLYRFFVTAPLIHLVA
ncbi:hypothetical protein BLD44_007780 [Mastigocladus laminosus UU774]|nr:hypothetical protein BLD44_007780 [Mastigocladus laminosus UU774]